MNTITVGVVSVLSSTLQDIPLPSSLSFLKTVKPTKDSRLRTQTVPLIILINDWSRKGRNVSTESECTRCKYGK